MVALSVGELESQEADTALVGGRLDVRRFAVALLDPSADGLVVDGRVAVFRVEVDGFALARGEPSTPRSDGASQNRARRARLRFDGCVGPGVER